LQNLLSTGGTLFSYIFATDYANLLGIAQCSNWSIDCSSWLSLFHLGFSSLAFEASPGTFLPYFVLLHPFIVKWLNCFHISDCSRCLLNCFKIFVVKIVICLHTIVLPILEHYSQDEVVSSIAAHGYYTPKLGYLHLSTDNHIAIVPWWWQVLWKSKSPSKYKVLVWCILAGKNTHMGRYAAQI